MDTQDENAFSELKNDGSPHDGEILVRADEIDEAGADIAVEAPTGLTTSASTEVHAQTPNNLATGDSATDNATPGTLKQPIRPTLPREASAPPPPPPRQPPPPAPPASPSLFEEGQLPTDSISLGQLKNIVATFPKLEPLAYAYEYADTRTFAEELEEWFQYTEEDRDLVESTRTSFEKLLAESSQEKNGGSNGHWIELSQSEKEDFVGNLGQGIRSNDSTQCLECLQGLAYLAMGVWYETTGKLTEPLPKDEADFEPPNQRYRDSVAQLACILESAELLSRLNVLVDVMRVIWHICEQNSAWPAPAADQHGSLKRQQLNAATTILYFVSEAGREQARKSDSSTIRESMMSSEANVIDRLSRIIARMRWEEESTLPFTKLILLLWKISLLIFGGSRELQQCKDCFKDESLTNDADNTSLLTTSPLDYHIFRQEVTSKYPAYCPPPPLIPLEANNNSILPPVPNHESRYMSYDAFNGPILSNGSNRSIFHQPVHIATPAPSPPPSPAGPGGKGGKKQNYQTNQNFPFLYPPLDSSSNGIGDKGKADLHGELIGKRWGGSDVPASIVEAGQLFASRMRMSRATKQLWEVREEFIKSERGWQEASSDTFNEQATVVPNELDLEGSDDLSDLEKREAEKDLANASSEARPTSESEDSEVQERLQLVEAYFRQLLPQLQSIIIVLLKVLLSNVSILGTANQNPNTSSFAETTTSNAVEGHLPQANINLSQQLSDLSNAQRADGDAVSTNPLEELNATRTREITSKAITAYVLHLLKWLRVSHVLKFEYAVELLIDSNYIPLALKYFALQDVDKAVDMKHDREDLDFFHLCHLLSGHPLSPQARPASPRPASSSSSDSAAPPPIQRNRRPEPAPASSSSPPSPGSPGSPQRRPEVDELGYPTTPLPPQPLTNYAPRFFHTYISTLRLLQKLTKGHAHRALMLVQYKSSTILRRALKIPQPTLRLYTLKLFKTQVPYCGRKWRQANMRVITAIYVFCRMGLRDDWISGGGQVEEMVDGALGVESAWRGLVAWWLSRTYRGALANADENGKTLSLSKRANVEEEDFFTRELEKMGWGLSGDALDDEEGEWDEWDEGPIQLDGW